MLSGGFGPGIINSFDGRHPPRGMLGLGGKQIPKAESGSGLVVNLSSNKDIEIGIAAPRFELARREREPMATSRRLMATDKLNKMADERNVRGAIVEGKQVSSETVRDAPELLRLQGARIHPADLRAEKEEAHRLVDI